MKNLKHCLVSGLIAIVPLFAFGQWTGGTGSTVYYNPLNTSVGIGTQTPQAMLDLRGNFLMETGGDPILYASGSTGETNRYFKFVNAPTFGSASGIKAGGIMVGDTFSWGSPGKNDLVVKGSIGIGTASPTAALDVRGYLVMEAGGHPFLYASTASVETNRYFKLLNSMTVTSAAGLMAGGVLVSDNYSFATPGKNDLVVKGTVGIGTATTGTFKLAVEGKVGAREVNVTTTTPWPDYVFVSNYQLPSLETVKSFIHQNHRLPEVPSAAEVEANGVNLGEMNTLLLKKIEELTLYMIDLKNDNEQIKKEMAEMKKEMSRK